MTPTSVAAAATAAAFSEREEVIVGGGLAGGRAGGGARRRGAGRGAGRRHGGSRAGDGVVAAAFARWLVDAGTWLVAGVGPLVLSGSSSVVSWWPRAIAIAPVANVVSALPLPARGRRAAPAAAAAASAAASASAAPLEVAPAAIAFPFPRAFAGTVIASTLPRAVAPSVLPPPLPSTLAPAAAPTPASTSTPVASNVSMTLVATALTPLLAIAAVGGSAPGVPAQRPASSIHRVGCGAGGVVRWPVHRSPGWRRCEVARSDTGKLWRVVLSHGAALSRSVRCGALCRP